jgi:hypothetical protein
MLAANLPHLEVVSSSLQRYRNIFLQALRGNHQKPLITIASITIEIRTRDLMNTKR